MFRLNENLQKTRLEYADAAIGIRNIPGMRSGAAGALRIVDRLEVASTDKFGNARLASWGL